MLCVLILGGYGTFGANIAKLLADEDRLTLIIAGRTRAKAEAFCELHANKTAHFISTQIDRSQDLTAQIKTPPDVIIDATGPFQSFKGDTRDLVIKYALESGAHYLDLSDDADFIHHIQRYDAVAKTASITALSGLSTYPVLGAAIADMMQEHIPNAHSLTTGIAPSPKAHLGRNVLSAILNTAGRKVIHQRKNGEIQITHGLLKTQWQVIAPPLGRPLKPLLFTQVDSPEAVFMDGFDGLNHISNYAGTQPIWMLRLLIALSHLARFRLMLPLRIFTSLFHHLHRLLTFGEHRSGYFLSLENDDTRADFHLTAEGDDGPFIPSIPAAIIVKKLIRGETLEIGARSGAGVIKFEDYETMLPPLNIQYGYNIEPLKQADNTPVYRQCLGQAFDALPAEIQSLHAISDIDVSIRRVPLGGNKELWERRFNGKIMRSTQEAGQGKREHFIVERFGPFAINLAYYKDGDIYRVEPRGWRAFGVPMPNRLCPIGDIYERAKDGKFHFHVDIGAPIIGRLVKYIGWFDPEPKTKPATDSRAN